VRDVSAARAPHVLLVDTSLAGRTEPGRVWDEVIDYAAVDDVPRWLRSSEQASRLDFSLARRAIAVAGRFDLLVAGSEKVGIPLALSRPSRPVVCVVHQIASPGKRALLKWLDVPSRWVRVGYQCSADRDLLASYYRVPPSRLVKFKSAPLESFLPGRPADGRYVLSIGTSKRDYDTLLAALEELPDVSTRVYASSRFGDAYRGRMPKAVSSRIEIRDHVDSASVPQVYEAARFVVLPIENTCQHSAGMTAALEAHAAGKAVVATATPGMRDCVIDGVTGLLVPVGDVGAMRAAIARLWSDPRLAAEMGMAGRAHVEQAFNPLVIDAGIRQAYVEACEEFRSAGEGGG
jgi:glycosyltransferase involved in cell wall biosynthesis